MAFDSGSIFAVKFFVADNAFENEFVARHYEFFGVVRRVHRQKFVADNVNVAQRIRAFIQGQGGQYVALLGLCEKGCGQSVIVGNRDTAAPSALREHRHAA